MMARFAVGSVSTLAMGALLLGSASFWLHRPGAASHATPWGDLSSLSARAAAPQADDEAQLLKVAALKADAPSPASPMGAQVVPAATPAPVAQAPSPDLNPIVAAPASDTETAQAASIVADPPAQMAAPEPVPDEAPAAAEEPAAKSSLVNLNTASPGALDRIPGVGHVGRTIVAHRPYRSVKDLVSKRVLRTSDYQKIAAYVGVQ